MFLILLITDITLILVKTLHNQKDKYFNKCLNVIHNKTTHLIASYSIIINLTNSTLPFIFKAFCKINNQKLLLFPNFYIKIDRRRASLGLWLPYLLAFLWLFNNKRRHLLIFIFQTHGDIFIALIIDILVKSNSVF